jgi:hypothetical protein
MLKRIREEGGGGNKGAVGCKYHQYTRTTKLSYVSSISLKQSQNTIKGKFDEVVWSLNLWESRK